MGQIGQAHERLVGMAVELYAMAKLVYYQFVSMRRHSRILPTFKVCRVDIFFHQCKTRCASTISDQAGLPTIVEISLKPCKLHIFLCQKSV